MHPETVQRYDDKFVRSQTITVDVLTVRDLFQFSQFDSVESFPLLSIDIEGLDELVLLDLLDSRFLFELIVIEDKNISLHSPFPHSSIGSILDSRGYCFIAKTPLNSFWISNFRNSFDWLPPTMLR